MPGKLDWLLIVIERLPDRRELPTNAKKDPDFLEVETVVGRPESLVLYAACLDAHWQAADDVAGGHGIAAAETMLNDQVLVHPLGRKTLLKPAQDSFPIGFAEAAGPGGTLLKVAGFELSFSAADPVDAFSAVAGFEAGNPGRFGWF